MGRLPRIPQELRRRPFSLEEARAAGITLSALRGRSWERIGSRLYRLKASPDDRWSLVRAFGRDLPESAVFVGRTAAWMHGLDMDPANPVHVALPPSYRLGSRSGVEIRHTNVGAEVVKLKGVAATRLHRTLLDLCAVLPPVEALVALDMACHAKLAGKLALRRYADGVKGHRGVALLRLLTEIAAPAESPMETRLRWLLHQARLAMPEVQTDLYDDSGEFLGRADLYYPQARLVIEFDGGNHRDRLVTDDRRQNAIVNAGYRILRFTAADVSHRPSEVVALVRAALRNPA